MPYGKQVFVVLCLALLGGCRNWRPAPLAPGVIRDLPAHSRLIKTDHETIDLATGHVTDDSVIGERNHGERIAIPKDSVASLEVGSLSWPRTLGAAYLAVFMLGILLGERI